MYKVVGWDSGSLSKPQPTAVGRVDLAEARSRSRRQHRNRHPQSQPIRLLQPPSTSAWLLHCIVWLLHCITWLLHCVLHGCCTAYCMVAADLSDANHPCISVTRVLCAVSHFISLADTCCGCAGVRLVRLVRLVRCIFVSHPFAGTTTASGQSVEIPLATNNPAVTSRRGKPAALCFC